MMFPQHATQSVGKCVPRGEPVSFLNSRPNLANPDCVPPAMALNGVPRALKHATVCRAQVACRALNLPGLPIFGEAGLYCVPVARAARSVSVRFRL